MALKAFLIAFLIAMVATPSLATKYLRGADDVWKLGLNYSALEKVISIHIAGTRVFMYKEGSHNIVLKMKENDMQLCVAANTFDALTNGHSYRCEAWEDVLQLSACRSLLKRG
ncbi:unnamed protein product [Fraxinus pennsylvanica]|uniref:Uncharacterized protein n=1 Tax=Fraxinus pennsylvanica TaxID=56036 RepID=A0AAD2EA57_9LAMI|nr:unnamed protein product [Fraxinus pennsylvanica]